MNKVIEADIPKHIAIILDGNGRWAKQRGLPRIKGHMEGVKRVFEIVEAAHRKGVHILTLYVFSTENWRRPQKEVQALMKLLLQILSKEIQRLLKNNIQFRTIGSQENVPESVKKILCSTCEKTKGNTGLILNVAFNYGSRKEIVDAVKNVINQVQKGDLSIDDVSEDIITKSLYTKDLPDPDLLIRTSGEKRISNFLLWQLSYSELYFTDVFWPDFDEKEFDKALDDFHLRERRFGDVEKKK